MLHTTFKVYKTTTTGFFLYDAQGVASIVQLGVQVGENKILFANGRQTTYF